MASIIAGNLAGSTITYNGVQFGGADSAYASVPPQYSIDGQMVYDEAGRAVIAVKYSLVVKTFFYATSEAAVASIMDGIREKLSAPGKTLTMEGIGLGFGTIRDLAFGPKPISVKMQPLGQVNWEVVWTCEFTISECLSSGSVDLGWMAWNYDTSWQNDFEGQCTRTIKGYVQIAGRRKANDQIENVADEVRDRVTMAVPDKFKRIVNNWAESADKTRLDFVVVDQQIAGDPYPPGIVAGDGYGGFSSDGPGFAKGEYTMRMSLRTAPNVGRGLAGIYFIQAIVSKQAAMSAALRQSGGVAIPKKLHIGNGKFDNARNSDCTMTWQLTKCLNAMLNAAGIWKPLIDTNYQQWRTSIEGLWANRGNAGLRSQVADELIIDVCDGIQGRNFGTTPSNPPSGNQDGNFQFGCPEIPADGGWLAYDLRVRVVRDDYQSSHRKAVIYRPEQSDFSDPYTYSLNNPTFNWSQDDYHVTEHHGYPDTLILLQYKLLRFKHKPVVPTIKSVGGKPVTLIAASDDQPRVAFDIFECPAWYAAGYKLYRVQGDVHILSEGGRPDSCAAPFINSTP